MLHAFYRNWISLSIYFYYCPRSWPFGQWLLLLPSASILDAIPCICGWPALVGNHPELLRTKNDDCPYSNQPFFGMANHRLDTSTQLHTIIANCLLLSPFYYYLGQSHGQHNSCHRPSRFVPLPGRTDLLGWRRDSIWGCSRVNEKGRSILQIIQVD